MRKPLQGDIVDVIIRMVILMEVKSDPTVAGIDLTFDLYRGRMATKDLGEQERIAKIREEVREIAHILLDSTEGED